MFKVRTSNSYKFYNIEYKRDGDDHTRGYEIPKDEAEFCLKCTKEKCNGNCKEINDYIKSKRSENG